jgi:hypothetical protein
MRAEGMTPFPTSDNRDCLSALLSPAPVENLGRARAPICDRPAPFVTPAHTGCDEIFLDLPVHTSCTRRLLTD